jgi:hypothetical protein
MSKKIKQSIKQENKKKLTMKKQLNELIRKPKKKYSI